MSAPQQKQVHTAKPQPDDHQLTNPASRTAPQNNSNRSSAVASPTQASNPTQPPAQQPKPQETSNPPPRSIWLSKQQERAASNGPSPVNSTSPTVPQPAQQQTSSFNIEDAKALLINKKPAAAPYKPASTSPSSEGRKAAGDKMANGQPFFATLAKQVANLEAGG
ncbi:hypothetical protein CBER1_00418 [Cercospora berteroae]|uniref:Uncharacterized protein n=1 Tax=Cercospora berteroae TaxID=357750 RepID=A0A2S6C170_9PEZI|nr:hypothetical protein CBER1_00418 [Cercospora berteroae]